LPNPAVLRHHNPVSLTDLGQPSFIGRLDVKIIGVDFRSARGRLGQRTRNASARERLISEEDKLGWSVIFD
jgi:hypothetical protein